MVLRNIDTGVDIDIRNYQVRTLLAADGGQAMETADPAALSNGDRYARVSSIDMDTSDAAAVERLDQFYQMEIVAGAMKQDGFIGAQRLLGTGAEADKYIIVSYWNDAERMTATSRGTSYYDRYLATVRSFAKPGTDVNTQLCKVEVLDISERARSHSESQQLLEHIMVCGCAVPTRIACAVFAAGVVIGQTGQNVCLPLYADAIGGAGSMPYFVVWFGSMSFVVLFGLAVIVTTLLGVGLRKEDLQLLSVQGQLGVMIIGLSNALNGMMLVFAAPSSRTAPYLQAILGNFIIPMTIVIRAALLRKRPTRTQLSAALLVVGGLFISLIPAIRGTEEQKGSMFWPIWFMLAFAPLALMNVVEEKVLKSGSRNIGMLWFVFWLNFWQFVFVSCLFWADLVPNYGMSKDMRAWAHGMRKGFECFAFSDECKDHSSGTPEGFVWGLSFILMYMLAYIAGGMLLKYSEGSVWQALVMALVGPLGTVWWTVFAHDPHFHYAPEWRDATTYALLGLGLIVPGIVTYKLRSEPDGVITADDDTEGPDAAVANGDEHDDAPLLNTA